jgi:hypothetical protein
VISSFYIPRILGDTLIYVSQVVEFVGNPLLGTVKCMENAVCLFQGTDDRGERGKL